jgi:hypothetical protein
VDVTPAREEQGERRPGGVRPSRRRLVALGAALAAASAGAVGIGVAAWPVLAESNPVLEPPRQVAGLTRDDSERARSAADDLRTALLAEIDLDTSLGVVYADPADTRRSVLLVGGTTTVWRPERGLDDVLAVVSDGTEPVTGLREVPAGELGGVMRCGSGGSSGARLTVCGWADHGSVALGLFPGRTVDQSGPLLRTVRQAVQHRD